MTFRSSEILALARAAPVCTGCDRPNDGTVVPAHRNEGKGIGLKVSDALVAHLCLTCHVRLDQGRDMTREERRAFWDAAFIKTMRWLIESGLLVVRPADYVEPVHAPKPKAKVGKGRSLPTGRKIPPGPKLRSRPTFR